MPPPLIGSGQLVFALAALPSGEFGRRVGVRGAFAAGLVLVGLAYALLLSVEALPRSAWVPWLLLWWAARGWQPQWRTSTASRMR